MFLAFQKNQFSSESKLRAFLALKLVQLCQTAKSGSLMLLLHFWWLCFGTPSAQSQACCLNCPKFFPRESGQLLPSLPTFFLLLLSPLAQRRSLRAPSLQKGRFDSHSITPLYVPIKVTPAGRATTFAHQQNFYLWFFSWLKGQGVKKGLGNCVKGKKGRIFNGLLFVWEGKLNYLYKLKIKFIQLKMSFVLSNLTFTIVKIRA